MNTLKYYYREVDKLRELGKEWNLTEDDIDKIIDDSFKFLEEHSCAKTQKKKLSQWPKLLFKFAVVVPVIILLFNVLYTYRKVAHNYVEQNVQEIIYPGMKLIRKIMLPVIQAFPSLTEWYDEACLVGNPYFQVSDIECWPCEGVKSILNLTSSNLSSDEYHSGIPFIYRDETMKKVEAEDVSGLYEEKKGVFEKEGGRLEDSRWGRSSPQRSLVEQPLHLHPSAERDAHITWKLNRLEATRAVRNLFGSISRLPYRAAGPTPEKFLLIDEENSAPYLLPDTEGTNIFIVQGSGSRLVLLNPSPECSATCHRVSIVLPPQHILWFNWWYWRAVSVPLNLNEGLSIAYMGSYF